MQHHCFLFPKWITLNKSYLTAWNSLGFIFLHQGLLKIVSMDCHDSMNTIPWIWLIPDHIVRWVSGRTWYGRLDRCIPTCKGRDARRTDEQKVNKYNEKTERETLMNALLNDKFKIKIFISEAIDGHVHGQLVKNINVTLKDGLHWCLWTLSEDMQIWRDLLPTAGQTKVKTPHNGTGAHNNKQRKQAVAKFKVRRSE